MTKENAKILIAQWRKTLENTELNPYVRKSVQKGLDEYLLRYPETAKPEVAQHGKKSKR